MGSRIERKNKMGFEIQDCTRCGGSGRYSYCQMYGDTCFKCGGTGVILTRRGNAAFSYYRNLFETQASNIVAGSYIRFNGKWKKVLNIKEDTLNAGFIVFELPNQSYHVPGSSKIESAIDENDRQKKLAEAHRHQEKLGKTGKVLKKFLAA